MPQQKHIYIQVPPGDSIPLFQCHYWWTFIDCDLLIRMNPNDKVLPHPFRLENSPRMTYHTSITSRQTQTTMMTEIETSINPDPFLGDLNLASHRVAVSERHRID